MESVSSAPVRADALSRVFHGSSQGVAVARLEDARVFEVNDAFLFLVARDRDEVIGATLTDLGLFSEIGQERALELLRERGTIDGFDARVSVSAGETRILRLWVEVVDGSEPLVVVRASDVDGRAAAGARYHELRETEIRYRALVEQVPAVIYTEVPDESRASGARPTYVSPQSTRILGYTPEELMGDSDLWDRMTHPDDFERVMAAEIEVDTKGEPFCHEYRTVTRAGDVRWIRDEAALIEDPVTGLRFRQGFMFDITEMRAAQEHVSEAQAKYRTLVEQIPAVVYLGEYGEEGDWLYISPQLERVLGYTPEEWLEHPHPLASFTHPDDIQAVRDAEELSLGTGEPFRAEYRMQAKDGRWVWLLDEAAVVRDEAGRILFMQGVMYDMTERKRAEEELADAYAKLQALDRLKNTLLHTLSHDLKGPLTAILGAASTLERLDRQLPEEERQSLLRAMVSRVKGMNTLLTDLLDLDRLDQGIVEPRRFPVDLGELVRGLVASTEPLAGRRVEVEADRTIVAVDPPKVERMVENLLVNAARHTPAGARVWVRVAREGDGALVVVEDDGAGVPDALKEAVFEPFRRGPNTDERPGAGIGLSLVARFAELHGGRAWVEDRPGGGASFRIFLPGAIADP